MVGNVRTFAASNKNNDNLTIKINNKNNSIYKQLKTFKIMKKFNSFFESVKPMTVLAMVAVALSGVFGFTSGDNNNSGSGNQETKSTSAPMIISVDFSQAMGW